MSVIPEFRDALRVYALAALNVRDPLFSWHYDIYKALGAVDNSFSDAQRPAMCSHPTAILLHTHDYCTETDRNRSREQVAGHQNLKHKSP